MPTCPQCGSANVTVAKQDPAKPAFTIVARRECIECGEIFDPPVPAWGKYGMVVAGVILAATGIMLPIWAFVLSVGVVNVNAVVVVSGVLVVIGVLMVVKAIMMFLGNNSNDIFDRSEPK